MKQGFQRAKINGEFVELYKVLKFEGLTQSGGQAKSVIANGEVNARVQLIEIKVD